MSITLCYTAIFAFPRVYPKTYSRTVATIPSEAELYYVLQHIRMSARESERDIGDGKREYIKDILVSSKITHIPFPLLVAQTAQNRDTES